MIETIFITALIVLFFYECTREGMIFYPVAKRLETLPDYIKKPLYDCPICMTIWWGALILTIGAINDLWVIRNFFEAVFILFSAAGVNTVLIYIIDQGKTITKVFGQYECNCEKKEDKILERRKRIASYDKDKKLWNFSGEDYDSKDVVLPDKIAKIKSSAKKSVKAKPVKTKK